MDRRCVTCGGKLEHGVIRAGKEVTDTLMVSIVSLFVFVRPGAPTSANPVKAFMQGLHEEPGEQKFPLAAFRCSECGRIELYAPAE